MSTTKRMNLVKFVAMEKIKKGKNIITNENETSMH